MHKTYKNITLLLVATISHDNFNINQDSYLKITISDSRQFIYVGLHWSAILPAMEGNMNFKNK